MLLIFYSQIMKNKKIVIKQKVNNKVILYLLVRMQYLNFLHGRGSWRVLGAGCSAGQNGKENIRRGKIIYHLFLASPSTAVAAVPSADIVSSTGARSV